MRNEAPASPSGARPVPGTIFASVRTLMAGGLLLAAARNATAEGISWDSVGLRSGFSITSFSDPFAQSELYSDWNLPYTLNMGTNWTLKPKLELSAGILTGHRHAAFVGGAGPLLELRHKKFPVYLEGGVRLTGLSRDTFGNRDLGIPFQFTSHIGFGWDITHHWNASYRFEHMSNAGLGTPNPGINMNMFGVGYRF